MTKREFIKLMKEFIQLRKDEEKLNEAFRVLEPNFNYISFGRHETLITDTLKIAMNDKYDWLGYWIYECYMGTDNKLVNSVEDKDGKKIPLKTLSNLYDCIVRI